MVRTVLASIVVLVVFGASIAHADGARIVVAIQGLRSSHGDVRGALFRSHGWIDEGREISVCEARIVRGRATCVIEGVPPGTYAFAFLHDEDDDGRLDRDWIGVPQEGFGFSNDAPIGLGPPSFESASFAHAGDTSIVVHARYGI